MLLIPVVFLTVWTVLTLCLKEMVFISANMGLGVK